ncbi:MAG: Protease DegQ [Verrucomicrobiota bacterium]|jgi:Do/DeqQ family serine protease
MRRIFPLLIIGILIGYGWWRFEHRNSGRTPEKYTLPEAPALNLDDIKILEATDAAFTRLVQAVMPSVVSITSSREVYQPLPLTIEDLLRGQQRLQKGESTSLGSGVIVSKEGHILTNHHVIANMTEIRVLLTDGRNIAAKLIGSDPNTDIAVLRIDTNDIQALPFGDSEAVFQGQQVVAVGNPYGLDGTATFGKVSATGRRTGNDSGLEYIQTDAAVNQGNSGGPLLNVRGEVIGINSSIFTKTGGWQGISFAIPANTAKRVMEGILKRGRLVRGWLGVNMQALTPRIAQNFGVPDLKGAIITSTMPGSPAERAGLQPGDVVRKVNGKPIDDFQMLRGIIASLEAGQKMEIEILRDGQPRKTTVTIEEIPPQFESRGR